MALMADTAVGLPPCPQTPSLLPPTPGHWGGPEGMLPHCTVPYIKWGVSKRLAWRGPLLSVLGSLVWVPKAKSKWDLGECLLRRKCPLTLAVRPGRTAGGWGPIQASPVFGEIPASGSALIMLLFWCWFLSFPNNWALSQMFVSVSWAGVRLGGD